MEVHKQWGAPKEGWVIDKQEIVEAAEISDHELS